MSDKEETKKVTRKAADRVRQRPIDKRPKRVSLRDQRDVLTVNMPDAEDYKFRWVNELDAQGHRIPRLEVAGYQIVPENVVVGHVQAVSGNVSSGAGARKQVGVDATGNPYYATLMRIRKEYWVEDQEAKSEAIRVQMADMRRRVDGEREGYYGETKFEQPQVKAGRH